MTSVTISDSSGIIMMTRLPSIGEEARPLDIDRYANLSPAQLILEGQRPYLIEKEPTLSQYQEMAGLYERPLFESAVPSPNTGFGIGAMRKWRSA